MIKKINFPHLGYRKFFEAEPVAWFSLRKCIWVAEPGTCFLICNCIWVAEPGVRYAGFSQVETSSTATPEAVLQENPANSVPLCLCASVPLCLCASVPLCLCAYLGKPKSLAQTICLAGTGCMMLFTANEPSARLPRRGQAGTILCRPRGILPPLKAPAFPPAI